ncbi:HAMP domain-containing sensor histidine kinase, partial [Singulisphaera rosea]
MFRTLRTKLFFGIAPLLAILVGLGLWAIAMFNHLGGRIDVILRENYESVLAAEGMKEALERMDSAAQFAVNGQDGRAREQYHRYAPVFQKNLDKERHNVTLIVEGEQEQADRLTKLFDAYLKQSESFYGMPEARRADFYYKELYRTFLEIKETADKVLTINQAKMLEEDRKAREAASRSERVMIVALLGGAAIATVIALVLSRSILEPIGGVTR